MKKFGIYYTVSYSWIYDGNDYRYPDDKSAFDDLDKALNSFAECGSKKAGELDPDESVNVALTKYIVPLDEDDEPIESAAEYEVVSRKELTKRRNKVHMFAFIGSSYYADDEHSFMATIVDNTITVTSCPSLLVSEGAFREDLSKAIENPDDDFSNEVEEVLSRDCDWKSVYIEETDGRDYGDDEDD